MPPKRIALTCERCSAAFLGAPYARKPGDRPQRFCSVGCRDQPNTDLATRFWAGVDRSAPDGCWPWTRARRNAQGHGGVWDGSRWTHAHRVAFRLTYGRILPGLEICHRCDNPPCCRPDHLFIGTHATNMADSSTKRRGKHRISLEVERRVLGLLAQGWSPYRIGRAVGISKSSVGRIRDRN